MTWEMRVRVALGAARGLAYLHEDCHPRIIHRDIKSSNILLDDKYEAQVSSLISNGYVNVASVFCEAVILSKSLSHVF